MKVAVVGAYGQLGSDLMPLLKEQGIPLGHDEIEITDRQSVLKRMDSINPTHIVNCAAYNLVDKAEAESELAFQVNQAGPENLAQYCEERRVVLLHVSTDYVFGADHSKRTPYHAADPTGPVSVYGASKLAGEVSVRSRCARHFIVRTCGLYGHRAARGKGNFVETMLRLGRDRPELRIVADQRCTPTATFDLARAIVSLIPTDQFGTYHATNSGDCSWYEFALEIFRAANIATNVIPCTAAEYGAKAHRPDYSVLNCESLERIIGWKMPEWRTSLANYLEHRTRQSQAPQT